MAKSPSVPIFVLDFMPPRAWVSTIGAPKRPVVAMVRKVNFSTRGKRILVGFSKAIKSVDVSSPEKLKKLFEEVGSGKFKFKGGISPKPKKPFRCPLSLNNQEYCYVIYMLSNKNWQFASKYYPITIESKAYNKIGAYAEAARISPDGTIVNDMDEKNDCRAAYFIANAQAAYESRTNQTYEHRINLHVDLKFEDDDGKPLLMPVIIDPDVRHPGGSGY